MPHIEAYKNSENPPWLQPFEFVHDDEFDALHIQLQLKTNWHSFSGSEDQEVWLSLKSLWSSSKLAPFVVVV